LWKKLLKKENFDEFSLVIKFDVKFTFMTCIYEIIILDYCDYMEDAQFGVCHHIINYIALYIADLKQKICSGIYMYERDIHLLNTLKDQNIDPIPSLYL